MSLRRSSPPSGPSKHKADRILGRCEVPTVLGPIGILWSAVGIRAVFLPGEAKALRVRKGWNAAEMLHPPRWVIRVANRLAAHLRGAPDPLTDVPVDLSHLTLFQQEVLVAARAIAPGTVLTYGELACRLGRSPSAARAVGGALARNPIPLVIPCHRVVGKDGGLCGFTAPGGVVTKRKLLDLEGVSAA